MDICDSRVAFMTENCKPWHFISLVSFLIIVYQSIHQTKGYQSYTRKNITWILQCQLTKKMKFLWFFIACLTQFSTWLVTCSCIAAYLIKFNCKSSLMVHQCSSKSINTASDLHLSGEIQTSFMNTRTNENHTLT